MVVEVIKRRKKYYVCDECGMGYVELKLAKKCESWHAKHQGCNMEIIKKAFNAERPCMFCGAKIRRRINKQNSK